MNTLIKRDHSGLIRTREERIYFDALDDVNLINGFTSINEFYRKIEPWTGLKIVYDHLEGWRKEAYRQFIMSGRCCMYQFGTKLTPECWGYGTYNEYANVMICCIRVYAEKTTNWNDFQCVERRLTWEEVVKAYTE